MPPLKSGIVISGNTPYSIQSFQVLTTQSKTSPPQLKADKAEQSIAESRGLNIPQNSSELFGGHKASESDSMSPKLLSSLNIRYPEEARTRGVEGIVEAFIYVSSLGDVENVEIIKADHPSFRSAAEDSFKVLKFAPAQAHGRSVPSKIHFLYKFLIKN